MSEQRISGRARLHLLFLGSSVLLTCVAQGYRLSRSGGLSAGVLVVGITIAVVALLLVVYQKLMVPRANRRLDRLRQPGRWTVKCIDVGRGGAQRALAVDAEGVRTLRLNGTVDRSWPWPEIRSATVGQLNSIAVVQNDGVILQMRSGERADLRIPTGSGLRFPLALAEDALAHITEGMAEHQRLRSGLPT